MKRPLLTAGLLWLSGRCSERSPLVPFLIL